MRIGLIGLPQVGKKTLFEILTAHALTEKDLASHKPIRGVFEVRDERFDKIASIFKPKKQTRAKIEVDLLPKVEKDTIAKGEIFSEINEMDAICHVVRAFADDSIYHIDGSVDAKRDIDFVNAELLLHDMIFIEKRLERLDAGIKKTKEESAVKEKELLLKLKAHLDKTLPLRLAALNHDETKIISGYPFTTAKEMMIVLNVSEDAIKDEKLATLLACELKPMRIEVMQVSAKLEDEIAKLGSDEERLAFDKEMGIGETAVHKFARLCMKTLGLVSFFTVESDELRQWPIRSGTLAHQAAGAIHSDLERGFIRAEVVKYDDILKFGSEEKVKEAGRLLIKGKDYVVEDGDVIRVRFNVS